MIDIAKKPLQFVHDTCGVRLHLVLNLDQEFIIGLRKYTQHNLVIYVINVLATS